MRNIKFNEENRTLIKDILKKGTILRAIRVEDEEHQLVKYNDKLYVVEIQYDFVFENENVVSGISEIDSVITFIWYFMK